MISLFVSVVNNSSMFILAIRRLRRRFSRRARCRQNPLSGVMKNALAPGRLCPFPAAYHHRSEIPTPVGHGIAANKVNACLYTQNVRLYRPWRYCGRLFCALRCIRCRNAHCGKPRNPPWGILRSGNSFSWAHFNSFYCKTTENSCLRICI